MNERLTTAGGVLIALLLVVGIFIQQPAEPPVTLPTSAEQGSNGYLGLMRWLRNSGLEVTSSRTRFSELPQISASGNLFITSAPYQRPIRGDEFNHLLAWVESGNTLLVLAALDDTPEWSMANDTSSFITDLEQLTGTTFEAATNADDEPLMVGELDATTAVHFSPAPGDHPLVQGINTVSAWSDSNASIWQPDLESPAPGVAFLIEQSSGLAAGWTRPSGRGHIVTIAAGSLFTNRALGESDNRVLLANLIRWHLADGGEVIFDDLHQGLSRLYDPEAFYSDSRVGISVLFVLVFWFIYMIGTQNRMLPVRASTSTPQQGDFVQAMGGFLARKLEIGSAARMMFQHWFDDLKSHGSLSAAATPWAQLEHSPLVDDRDLAALQRLHQRMEAGEKIDLAALHNRIQRIREALG